MKGIIYVRVSSEEQVEGTSLDGQLRLCQAYCSQKGITVVGIFREEGVSAKDLSIKNRPQLIAALDFCGKQKDIQAFVVFKVDRFARNTEDHFAVRRILLDSGTHLHSVTEPIGNKPAEKFIETVLAGAAEYDNAIRTQRCMDGMAARIQQGIWPFRAPPGYACAHHRQKGEKKTVPDEPDVRLFPLIQRALVAYANGEVPSQVALTHQLNTWGFETAYGRRATPQLVDRILGRFLPFYAGVVVSPWTSKEYAGLHKPMISQVEMAAIRQRRSGLKPGYPAKRHRVNKSFPLRRLLRCMACSNFMTGACSRGNGGTYLYYYCTKLGCRMRSKCIRAEIIHEGFEAYLGELRPSPVQLGEFKTRCLRILKDQRRREAEQVAAAIKLADLEKRRARVHEMREDGTYDLATFRERIGVVETEMADAKAKLASNSGFNNLSLDEASEAVTTIASNLWYIWSELSLLARSRFEQIFFPNGLTYSVRTGFQTTKLGPIFSLLGVSPGSLSHGVPLEGITSNQLQEYLDDLVELNRLVSNKPSLVDERVA